MGGVAVLLLLVSALTAVAAQRQDYCRLCRDHTMCLYTGVGPKCAPYLEGGVSTTDVATILQAINTYRQKVAQGQELRGSPGPQPSAANMRMMVWSPELATVAQRWAEQCDFSTDKCRSVSLFRSVGQGVYQSSTTGSEVQQDWQGIINKWSNDVTKFNNSFVSQFQWSDAGMYSQLVWADSHQVGCGYAVYKESQDNEWTHQYNCCVLS